MISWSIVHIPATGRMVYDITFKRLSSESSMEAVLQRPWTEEVEDYAKYKRLKKSAREKRQEAERKALSEPERLASLLRAWISRIPAATPAAIPA